jgi:hypothetical protein
MSNINYHTISHIYHTYTYIHIFNYLDPLKIDFFHPVMYVYIYIYIYWNVRTKVYFCRSRTAVLWKPLKAVMLQLDSSLPSKALKRLSCLAASRGSVAAVSAGSWG